jgi:regulator of sigma E protease
MEIIQSIIGFFIAIGILVTFHEFGHFYVARLFNVKVLNFAIGFGRTIYKKKFNPQGTEYSIGLIPLGGYVKMLESQELENIKDKDESVSEKYCFDKQSVYKRFLIVAAGPVFNLILAVIFFIVVHFLGISGIKPLINSINNIDHEIFSTSENLEIKKVNNASTKRWQDVRVEILNSIINNEKISIHMINERNEKYVVSIPYNPDILQEKGDILSNIGINPKTPEFSTKIGFVENNSPASLAGLAKNDVILSINDQEVATWSSYVSIIQNNPNNILRLKILRDKRNVEVILVPSVKELNGKNIGYAGVSPDKSALSKYTVNVKYSLLDSINKSFKLTLDYTILTFKMIFKLFTGQANMNNISGPLSIAEFSGKSLSMGIVYFAYLLAILSISLGVLNLLPIPVLDGGHLVYYIFEMIAGKPVSYRVQLIGQQIGLVILFGIMIVAFYNDFLRLFK